MKTIILEDWQVKNLRDYFGQNDATQTSHWAFPIFDKAHKEAINDTHCCTSKAEQLCDKNDYGKIIAIRRFEKGEWVEYRND